MVKIEFYGTPYCPFCIRAKALLNQKQAEFEEIRVDMMPMKRKEMMDRGGGYTVPQIFIDNIAIGGCDELHALERQGKQNELLG